MKPINQAIIDRHSHSGTVDDEQLQAIFSSASHLIVEAPAGYGKTNTMVSKIAHLISTGELNYPKKLLALTFSINAAFKIRKDIAQQLPAILSTTPKLAQSAIQAAYTTNYHGFCRRVLTRFGYLTHKALSQIDTLKGIGIDIYDDPTRTKNKILDTISMWGITLTENEIETLIQFTKSVHSAGELSTRTNAIKFLIQNNDIYLQIMKENFLPKGIITFDAILLFTRQIFKDHPEIREFYRSFFPMVIIDEFQDTNILQWGFLQDLVGRDEERKNHLFLFGDRYQRIYDFIGAMEGIIDKAKSQFHMEEIQLLTNHRFKNNPALLQLDANIRKIAQSPQNPDIKFEAPINVTETANQDKEAEQIFNQINLLLAQDPNSTIAVLTRAGKDNKNTSRIVEYLNSKKDSGFSYFFALYSDEDDEYIDFHAKCLSAFYTNMENSRSFFELCNRVVKDMNIKNPSETWMSLQTLLKTFFSHTIKEFNFLSIEEKTTLVLDTLRNKALKQYLMYITDSQVTLSTIHGSKGLEWDYVILPDIEKNSFPSYLGLCKECQFGQKCDLKWNQIRQGNLFAKLFSQELNVFYVGSTRARKLVHFVYSVEGLNYEGKPRKNNISCFLKLKGIQIQ